VEISAVVLFRAVTSPRYDLMSGMRVRLAAPRP